MDLSEVSANCGYGRLDETLGGELVGGASSGQVRLAEMWSGAWRRG